MADREHDTEANSGNERRDHRRATSREHRERPGGAGRRHCARDGRTARPTALWPFGAAASAGPLGVLGWLERVLAALITGYTEPGERVCLLAPPRRDRSRDTITGCGLDTPHPYDRLTEAAGVITRLGRTVVIASIEELQGEQHSVSAEFESGLGPEALRPRGPHPDQLRVDAGLSADAARGVFALIIATAEPALHPQRHRWLAEPEWHRFLTPTGTLAVLTHSDCGPGDFVDPLPQIVNTLRYQSLVWWESIAVLNPPLNQPHKAPGGFVPDPADTSTKPLAARHHDLLLFAPPRDESRSSEPPGVVSVPVEPGGTVVRVAATVGAPTVFAYRSQA